MQIDKTSFNDISIFNHEESFSIFHKLNFTRTFGGKEWLKRFFSTPFNDLNKIKGTQSIIKKLTARLDEWPPNITNGTMLVIEKFLEYALDKIGNNPGTVEAYTYRLLHSADYGMVRFSMKHFVDFFAGLKKITELMKGLDLPIYFQIYIDRITSLLTYPVLKEMSETSPGEPLSINRNLHFAANVRGD